MKLEQICIVGAGAIGSLLGARLASLSGGPGAGPDGPRVSALARGATLAALRGHGWRLRTGPALVQAPVAAASEHAADLGPQDLVILAVKAPALPALAPALLPLLHESTIVLPAMNGVPWWFCHGIPGFESGLRSVDPDGRIGAAIDHSRVLAGVVHASATVEQPGLVRLVMDNGLIIGEPAGGGSERARAVGALLRRAGFDVTVSEQVRRDVWYKLWGNMTMNPVGTITGASIDQVLADPLVRDFCSAAMREAARIGAAVGCAIEQDAEDRHAVTARLGAFRTSMQQDAQAGRPIELDALVGAPREIARRLGIETPAIDAMLGLTRLFARTRGLYSH